LDALQWFELEFYGNSIRAWIVAAAITVALLIVIEGVLLFLRGRFRKAHKSEGDLPELFLQLIRKTFRLFLFFPAAYFGLRALELPPKTAAFITNATILAVALQIGIWVSAGIDHALQRYRRTRLETDAAAATTIAAFSFIARLVLWVFVLLVALQNVGVNVTTLVAGLGVGGIAIALATQNILGDLFASLSIIIDKPFVIGDFIVVGTELGTVEYVGLKTTRVRSIGGEQIIFSNADLLQSRVRNFKRMVERRIVFTIGATYQTPAEKIALVPAAVRQIIEGIELTRADRCHFKGFGASSLDFEFVYFVLSPEFATYMDIQQKINLAIVDYFQREGIEFAYPTQTIHLAQAETR
jgi:small-conductance mechanosensitive channel